MHEGQTAILGPIELLGLGNLLELTQPQRRPYGATSGTTWHDVGTSARGRGIARGPENKTYRGREP